MSEIQLFSYGTLQAEEVMRYVTGSIFPGCPARLEGFSCRTLERKLYPGVVESPGQTVAGILYREIGEEALAALDRFEDDLYERRQLLVTLEDNEKVKAEVYVVPSSSEHLLSTDHWSYEQFRARDFERYMERVGRWCEE